MPFRLPKKCRSYFGGLTGKDEAKLNILFDGYYLCVLVGLAQAKIDSNADLEPSEFVDEYPNNYQDSRDYIAALLIATEAIRIPVDVLNANALEKLMTLLVDSHSKTRLSKDGEERLNQYAARGIDVIIENMAQHSRLEVFFQDYFECFEKELFFK
jgi:hypothetical protein